jgi:hypothetical protein
MRVSTYVDLSRLWLCELTRIYWILWNGVVLTDLVLIYLSTYIHLHWLCRVGFLDDRRIGRDVDIKVPYMS